MNFVFAVSLLVLSVLHISCSAQSTGGSGVYLNGQEVSTVQLNQYEQATGVVVKPGKYW